MPGRVDVHLQDVNFQGLDMARFGNYALVWICGEHRSWSEGFGGVLF
jgi:hypothetical protein